MLELWQMAALAAGGFVGSMAGAILSSWLREAERAGAVKLGPDSSGPGYTVPRVQRRLRWRSAGDGCECWLVGDLCECRLCRAIREGRKLEEIERPVIVDPDANAAPAPPVVDEFRRTFNLCTASSLCPCPACKLRRARKATEEQLESNDRGREERRENQTEAP